jgi:arylsulfatase A-like enzyme
VRQICKYVVGLAGSRRGAFLLASLLIAALTIVSAGISSAAPGSGNGGRPNILFIVTDDQRAETLDVMPKTKSLFDGHGTAFPNAYATTPVCCPSRASIFTGLYAHNHGVKRNNQGSVLDHNLTIQRRLQQVGYRTGIFGKFLNNWTITQSPPFFEKWAVFNNSPYTNFRVNEQGTVKFISQYATSYVAQKAVEFIRQADQQEDNRPWFLYVAPTAPHEPFTPEEKYLDAPVPEFAPNPASFEPDRSDKPPYVQQTNLDPDVVLAHRVAQLRMLKSVDDLVSKVFASLSANRELGNTLAIFVSDNGYQWGEHGLESKHTPYTYSVKIPMYMRWPDRLPAGVDDQRIVANLDLAPTALDAANVDQNSPMDGRSLLQGQARDRILLERLSRLAGSPPNWASIRTPSLQYTETYADSDWSPSSPLTFQEHYDLGLDPWQLTNTLGDTDPLNDPAPETILALRSQLARDLNCAGHGEVQGRPACP